MEFDIEKARFSFRLTAPYNEEYITQRLVESLLKFRLDRLPGKEVEK